MTTGRTALVATCFAVYAVAAVAAEKRAQGRNLLEEEQGDDTLIPYHGWFMATAFAIIFPAGAALPVFFKGTKFWPVAFQVHRVIQVIGMAFMIVGLALGQKLANDDSPKQIHRGIGIAVFALVWAQGLLALFARPATHGKARGVFNVLHWWGGRTAIVVGIGNTYYGMNISLPATRYFVGFSVAIGGWLLIAVTGQVLLVLFNYYDSHARDRVLDAEGKPATGLLPMANGAITTPSAVPA